MVKTTKPRGDRAYYDDSTYRTEESIGFLMKVAVELMAREIDARMEALGLTDAQWRPLLLLSRSEAQTAAQLARMSTCDTGALTRMLDRLEEKGFVRRQRSTDDRRVVHLELTAEGRRAVAVVPREICEVLNGHLAGLSNAETDQLKELLQRVVVTARNRAAERNERTGDA